MSAGGEEERFAGADEGSSVRTSSKRMMFRSRTCQYRDAVKMSAFVACAVEGELGDRFGGE